MEPWAEDELLAAAGFSVPEGLSSDEAADAALDHEVIPTSDGGAGDIHAGEVA